MIWPSYKSRVANELANERGVFNGVYLEPVMALEGVVGFVMLQVPDNARCEKVRETLGSVGC